MSRDYGEKIARVRRYRCSGRDGRKRDRRANNGASNGDGDEVDEPGSIYGHLALGKLAEEGAERQYMVARNGIRDPLGAEKTTCCRTGRIYPEQAQDSHRASLAHDLDEVLTPIVSIRGGDDPFEILQAKEDDDQRWY